MIKKILVSLDGSEASNRALDFALDLAEKYSAEVILFTVVQPVTMPFYIFEEMPTPVVPEADAYSKRLEAYSRSILSEALKRVEKEKPNLKVSSRLEEGRPADKIVQAAEDEGCDIIVMGSRGLSGVKELFLGSVSDKVADKATCPVLIVKCKHT